MFIRKARISDSQSISQLIQNTLETVNSADYNSDQIAAWKKTDTEEKVKERIIDNNRYVCVAIDKNEIIGVGGLKNDEITAVYVKSNSIGKGVGSTILLHLEKKAEEAGITEIKTDSSITAVQFYKKHGYKVVRNSCHKAGDVKLNCVVLKKELSV